MKRPLTLKGAMGRGRVVDVSEWENLQIPDIYFSYRYHRISALLEDDYSHVVLLEWQDEGGKIYLPLIVRSIGETQYFDATSAYGYGGPWVVGVPSMVGFQKFFDEWALQNLVVCTFLRFHPLVGNGEVFSNIFPVEYVGPTAGWDLSGSDDLLSGMSKGHRKSLRKALKAGVEPRVIEHPDDLQNFVRLYEMSMNRLAAGDFYHFPDAYWMALCDSLQGHLLLVDAILNDQIVATVLCLISENYLHFHLSGTTEEGRNVGAAVVCRLAAAEWAQGVGISAAHFGGGVGGADSSLLTWKKRFDENSPLHQFSVAKVIHNEEVFLNLASSAPSNDFFPPWRGL